MQKLVTVRELCGFPFTISSAYRCPDYNKLVSTTGLDGPHTLGLAADVLVWGEKALQLISIAVNHGMTGIGIDQKGVRERRFVHVDCVHDNVNIPRPALWTY